MSSQEPDSNSDLDLDDEGVDPEDAHMSDSEPGCEHNLFSQAIQINNHMLSGI